jgi:hypothetical protein
MVHSIRTANLTGKARNSLAHRSRLFGIAV